MRECYCCKREVKDCEGMIESFIGKICVECDYKAWLRANFDDAAMTRAIVEAL
jgi:hypothetical protein